MTISRRVALCCLLLYPLGGVTPSVAAQSYCADVRFADSGACSGPGKPSPTKITDAARRMGSPVRVRNLTHELMR